MRLFVGLFPPEHVGNHLDMAVESVSVEGAGLITGSRRPDLRWVPPEGRHITLAFYGEVPAGAAEELEAQLESELSAAAPLELRLRGAGVFSGRTLWAGVQEQTPAEHSNGSSPLIELMQRAEQAGVGCARSADPPRTRERRRAHVTLARTRHRRKSAWEIRHMAEALAVYEGPVWAADTAQLMLSELGHGKSGAPRYSSIAELPLRRDTIQT